MEINKVFLGDSAEILRGFPDESVDCVVTSPPYYGLRDYGVEGQIGLEDSPEAFVERLVMVFREVKRVLKKDGTCWVNLGDSYCGTGDKGDYKDPKYKDGRNGQSVAKNRSLEGYKAKDLIGIPWMFAFAMRADGWYLRQDIIWAKPNPMPESVTDRCVKIHEYIFLFSKSKTYYFDYRAIQEECVDEAYKKREDSEGEERKSSQGYALAGGHRNNSGGFNKKSKNTEYDGQTPNSMHLRRLEGEKDKVYEKRNKRDVWSVNVQPTKEAHFATYPQKLITPCILAGCRVGGVVLDPFMGSGTTGIVARKLERNFIGIELNPEYRNMAERRIFNEGENLFNQE